MAAPAPVKFDGLNTVENELPPLNQAWASSLANAQPTLFPALAAGQHPKILWLGCSDSRVPETMLLGLFPGEVFVHRNIANLLHPTDISFPAVLRYALVEMSPPVQHIIVCGHIGCGGCKAVLTNEPTGQPAIDNWLVPLVNIKNSHQSMIASMASTAQAAGLAKLNVQRSLGLLKVDPLVSQMLSQRNPLMVHGAIYDVGTGLLSFLEGSDQVEPPLEPVPPPLSSIRSGRWLSQHVTGGLQTKVEGDITFSQAYSIPPLIMIGLFGFDMTCQNRASFSGTVSNITNTGFHMKAQSAGDLAFWQSSWNWIEIPQDGSYADFQTGVWSTTSVHSGATPQVQTSQQINFSSPYTAAPSVVVWVNGWDSPGGSSPLSVSAYVTNITATGFTIHLDGASSALYSGSVNWMSYSTTSLSGVSSGILQSVNSGQGASGNVALKAAPAGGLPYTGAACLSSFAFNPTQTMKAFTVIGSQLSTTSLPWSGGTWGGSALVSASGGYIAIPPIA